MNLMDVSPATDLAVLLFAPELKVTLPSSQEWQELEERQQQAGQQGGQQLQQQQLGQQKQEEEEQKQQLKQEQEEGGQRVADCKGEREGESGPRPEWLPAAEATLLEGFMVYKFPAAGHLAAVLQLRQHLRTLLRIQVAGGGLQAQGFSESMSRVLCRLLEGGQGRDGVLGALKESLQELEGEGEGKAEAEKLEKELQKLEQQQARRVKQKRRQLV
jgi:hypothetical protein